MKVSEYQLVEFANYGKIVFNSLSTIFLMLITISFGLMIGFIGIESVIIKILDSLIVISVIVVGVLYLLNKRRRNQQLFFFIMFFMLSLSTLFAAFRLMFDNNHRIEPIILFIVYMCLSIFLIILIFFRMIKKGLYHDPTKQGNNSSQILIYVSLMTVLGISIAGITGPLLSQKGIDIVLIGVLFLLNAIFSTGIMFLIRYIIIIKYHLDNYLTNIIS